MPGHDTVLSWLHIGDLHLTEAGAGERNRRDVARIGALAGSLPA